MEYLGHTVNFKTYTNSIWDKKQRETPLEKQAVFENTHEAIVDKETWELAQKLRKTPRHHDTLGEANPLTGLLFCADCGAKMYNHKEGAKALKEGWKPDPDSGLYPTGRTGGFRPEY